MGDTHFVYKDVEGTSTQWDDLQRKLGNLPAKPPAARAEPWAPALDDQDVPKDRVWLDDKTVDELEDLEDEPDLDDNRFFEEYRSEYSIHFPKLLCFHRCRHGGPMRL